MEQRINPLLAMTKLSRNPSEKYFVLAYFLPSAPYTHEVEGEIFAYAMALRSFNGEREALEYRNFVEEATGHHSVFVVGAMEWTTLATRCSPSRLRNKPESLDSDINAFQKRLREQEKIRQQLIDDFEAKLAQESDPTTLPFYARMLYDGVKVAERILKLEKELAIMKEVLQEKKGAVQRHHNEYPEHDDQLEAYFTENLGDLESSLMKNYHQEWTS